MFTHSSDFHPSVSGSGCRTAAKVSMMALVAIAAALVGRLVVADEPTFEVLRDQVYAERDSGPLTADVFVPKGDGPFPGMLVVHGGAWAYGSKQQLSGAARLLASNGYTAAAISYRLAPDQLFPAQIFDCQAAVRWLRKHATEFKLDPARLGGFGYSAGGHLVALAGALDDAGLHEGNLPADAPSARLQVVIAGGAPCDFSKIAADNKGLAYWLGGTPAEKPDAYREASPANFVTADDPPMFFFHGAKDDLVPIDSPRAMSERLAAAGVTSELYTVPDAGHMEAAVNEAAFRRALKFADQILKLKGASGHGQ